MTHAQRSAVILAASALALGLVASTGGCAKHRRAPVMTTTVIPAPPPAEVVVSETPPKLPQEDIPPSPMPGYCWVPGYWSWQGRWVWIRGAWVIPPHPHATYVPGRWVHRGHGYVWTSGHWR